MVANKRKFATSYFLLKKLQEGEKKLNSFSAELLLSIVLTVKMCFIFSYNHLFFLFY